MGYRSIIMKAASAQSQRRRLDLLAGGPNPIPLTVNATRTTGVAPLAVSFECTTAPELTSPEIAFTEWNWAWNYDDVGSGTWAIDGASKNTDQNPIGAHVFESPGTYDVVCTLTDPGTGDVYQGTVQVVVSDPDTVFAGTATRCYSSSGDFTGAPAGATQITESDFRVVLADMAAGRRLLLRAGDSFSMSAFISPNEPVGPGMIGKFGAGADPVITSSAGDISFIGLVNSGDVLRDWRFVDLDLSNGAEGSPTGSFFFAVSGGTAHQCTFLRCSFNDFRINVQLQMNNTTRNEEVAVVDCVSTNTGFVSLFPSSGENMILGNDLDFPTLEHTIRTHYYPRSVFAHNRLRGASAGRHAMKMCALATNASNPNGTNGETELTTWSGYQSAEFWAIGDNIIEAGASQWTVAIGPQSADYDERVRYGTIARNTLVAAAGTTIDCIFFGVDTCTFRDNLCDNTAKDVTNWRVETRGIEPAPTNNRCVDNVFQYAALPPASALTTQDGTDTGTVISGNTTTT